MILIDMSNINQPTFFHLTILYIVLSSLYFMGFKSLLPLSINLTHKQSEHSIIIDLITLFVGCLSFWYSIILIFRFIIRRILSYTDWIFDNPKSPSFKTKLWRLSSKMFLNPTDQKLYDFQTYLPKFPLQKLDKTVSKYLLSVKPLLSKEEFDRHEELSLKFLQREGLELQKALVSRHKSTDNYVSQYWEDFAYLTGKCTFIVTLFNLSKSLPLYCIAGRQTIDPTDDTSPNPGLMLNVSVSLHCPFGTPQDFRQASRAASISHLQMCYRHFVQTEKFPPFTLAGTSVPLCSEQYRRLYNTTRRACREPIDQIMCYPSAMNGYIVVYSKGRYLILGLLTKLYYLLLLQFVDITKLIVIRMENLSHRNNWKRHFLQFLQTTRQ